MSAIQTVVYDFSIMSLLILVGFFLRKHFKIFQNLYIPASLIGGFLGCILGPQILGRISPIYLTSWYDNGISAWSSVMMCVIFSASFLGKKSENMGETTLSCTLTAMLSHQTQIIAGLICVGICIFLMGYDLPIAFGYTACYGFYGGHGTAASVGSILQDMGWQEGTDVAVTMATAGLVFGIVFGVIMINIAARKGKTKYVKEPAAVPTEILCGYIAPKNRKPYGYAATQNDTLDPFCFNFCFVGIICLVAYLLRMAIISCWAPMKNVPWFAYCLVLSMIINTVMNKAGYGDVLDRGSMNRISGTSMEYLVCAACMTINLKTVVVYAVPLAMTIIAVAICNTLVITFVGNHIFATDSFERQMGVFGQSSGVLATGLMLVRILDPEGRSSAADGICAGSTFGYLLQVPYFSIMPVLCFSMGYGAQLALAIGIAIALLIAARVLCWHKTPAWKTQKAIWEE